MKHIPAEGAGRKADPPDASATHRPESSPPLLQHSPAPTPPSNRPPSRVVAFLPPPRRHGSPRRALSLYTHVKGDPPSRPPRLAPRSACGARLRRAPHARLRVVTVLLVVLCPGQDRPDRTDGPDSSNKVWGHGSPPPDAKYTVRTDALRRAPHVGARLRRAPHALRAPPRRLRRPGGFAANNLWWAGPVILPPYQYQPTLDY